MSVTIGINLLYYYYFVYVSLLGFALVPIVMSSLSRADFLCQASRFAEKHTTDLPSESSLAQEMDTWFRKWSGVGGRLDLPGAYQFSLKSGLYPNIEYLLKILLTIPVTSATTERANSTIKYIKTRLRSSLSQLSLNAMVLGYQHKDFVSRINSVDLLDQFVAMKRRRMLLVNPTSE